MRFRHDLIGDEVEAACRGDYPLLCLAEAYEARRREEGDRAAQVLITDVPVAPDRPGVKFWLHREAVSVITTWDWRWIEQPGIYEYLAYTLILQALMIHMDTGCGEPGFQADRGRGVVSGNVFENQPREPGVIAAVLAGHLGTNDRLLLLDCFGPAYLHRALELISLDWLRTDPVRDNLRRVYGVALPHDG